MKFSYKIFLAIFTIILVAVVFSVRTKLAVFVPTADAEKLVQKGNYYFNVGGKGKYDLDKAGAYFERALLRDGNVADAWHQLARIDPDSVRQPKVAVRFL